MSLSRDNSNELVSGPRNQRAEQSDNQDDQEELPALIWAVLNAPGLIDAFTNERSKYGGQTDKNAEYYGW